MKRKLCVQNGEVYFPEKRKIKSRDILVSNGLIAQIDEHIEPDDDTDILDAKGKLVTPGLIDFHAHAFRYVHPLSIDINELAPRSGTTSFVDAGSSGAFNFVAFREYVINQTNLNLFAYLNISGLGQTTDGIRGLHFYENDEHAFFHLSAAREVIQDNRDIIKGIKVRMYLGLEDLTCMRMARSLADELHLPIMVHLAPPPPSLDKLFPYLTRGDVITHPYHGGVVTILDNNGLVRPEFWEAKERGIEVDVGLDRFHGNLRVMSQAVSQGFTPDYISSDIVIPNLHNITFDLPTTVSKFIAVGIPLVEALYMCTAAPAIKLGMKDKLGTLKEGARADIAIFEVIEDGYIFEDYFGNKLVSTRRLLPVTTVSQGKMLKTVQPTIKSYGFVINGKMAWETEQSNHSNDRTELYEGQDAQSQRQG